MGRPSSEVLYHRHSQDAPREALDLYWCVIDAALPRLCSSGCPGDLSFSMIWLGGDRATGSIPNSAVLICFGWGRGRLPDGQCAERSNMIENQNMSRLSTAGFTTMRCYDHTDLMFRSTGGLLRGPPHILSPCLAEGKVGPRTCGVLPALCCSAV